MPDDDDKLSKKTWLDIAFKVLSVLIIPLILWGFKLEKAITTQTLQISSLEQKIGDMKDYGVTLVRLDERLKSMDRSLTDIKDLLRKAP